MRKLALITMLMLPAILLGCGGTESAPPFTMAVIGDQPYGTTPTDTSQLNAYPSFISAVNADTDVSLVLHAGDIHSGKTFCTQDYDQAIFNLHKTFKMPMVYTPGDNEWADCHKSGEGGGTYNATTGQIDYVKDANGNQADYKGGDPFENLKLVRSLFFATPGATLGSGTLTVNSQATKFDPSFPADKDFVENVWFEKSKIMFVTVNMPGGSNNDNDIWYGAPTMSASQTNEIATRTAADLHWINAAFQQAKAAGDLGIVIMLQADMWDLGGAANNSHIAQYKQFIDAIATGATSFGKPVLLINGDSHIYRSDNPLVQGATCVTENGGTTTKTCTDDAYASQPNGYNVPNFHRIVVHGSTTPLEWLKLKVDPLANTANSSTAFGPFSWTRTQP